MVKKEKHKGAKNALLFERDFIRYRNGCFESISPVEIIFSTAVRILEMEYLLSKFWKAKEKKIRDTLMEYKVQMEFVLTLQMSL